MDAEFPDLLEANERFYEVFASGDLEAMDALWSRQARVTCIHPGWGLLDGREDVMNSWERVLGSDSRPDIRCARATAYARGDMAVVLCTEILPEGELIATNVFVREDDEWRINHHQAGPVARRPGKGTSGPSLVN